MADNDLAAAARKVAAAEAAMLKAARHEVEALLKPYGLTLAQLVSAPTSSSVASVSKAKVSKPTPKKSAAKKGKGTRPVKYKSSDGKTWAGGGSMPNWMKEAMNGGTNPADLLTDRKLKQTPAVLKYWAQANRKKAKASGKPKTKKAK